MACLMADRYGQMSSEPLSSPLSPVILLLEPRGSLGEGEWLIEAGEPLLRFETLILTLWGSDIVSKAGRGESQ